MSSPDELLCADIIEWLRSQPGWTADRLPPDGEDKTPDLEAKDARDRYIVEVKQKGDAPDRSEERERDLASGRVANFSEPAHRTSLRKVIGTGVKQLATRAGDDSAVFRIILIRCEGGNSEGQAIQVGNAAFGSCRIWQLDGPPREGYFVRESAFYRHRDGLDAIIVLEGSAGKLLLNSYSPRADRLRDSGFVRLFRPNGLDAVVDPMAEEAKGYAFVADGNFDRKDEAAALDYLKRKYGTGHIMMMDMASSAGVIRPSAMRTPCPPESGPPYDERDRPDRWYLHADLREIVEAVTRALPEPWECGPIRLRTGPHEAVATVRRRGDRQTSTVRIDLLQKRVNVDDVEGLA